MRYLRRKICIEEAVCGRYRQPADSLSFVPHIFFLFVFVFSGPIGSCHALVLPRVCSHALSNPMSLYSIPTKMSIVFPIFFASKIAEKMAFSRETYVLDRLFIRCSNRVSARISGLFRSCFSIFRQVHPAGHFTTAKPSYSGKKRRLHSSKNVKDENIFKNKNVRHS